MFSWSICTFRTLFVWVCPMLESKKALLLFLIDVYMLCPVVEWREALSLFSWTVCASRPFCVWIYPVLETNKALWLFYRSVYACRTFFLSGYARVGKKIGFFIVFLISLCIQDVLSLGLPRVGKKIGFIIVFWSSLCMQDLLCLWMPRVGKKKVFKIVYLISLCMQDVLCLGMPHVGKKIGFIIGFLISLCIQDILCFGMPWSVCACMTFCVWVCPVLEMKKASLVFSWYIWPFVSGYALCWKENMLYHYYFDQSVHAGPFLSGYAPCWKRQ